MKKLYSLVVILVAAVSGVMAQCTIDTNAVTTPGVHPPANQLPCITRNQAYDETVQGKIQESRDTTIFGYTAHIKVDSVRLDSIAGLPSGISWVKNPNILYGGQNGCVKFTGTTTDSAKVYNLTAFGTVWLRAQATGIPVIGNIDTPIVRNGNLNQFSPFGGYYLEVINPGDTCHKVTQGTGINDFSQALNAAFKVYPNPSNGVFEVKVDAGQRLDGNLVVVDVTGRTVYTERIDVLGLYNATVDLRSFAKGIYTVQLRTTAGVAGKTVSIE